MTAVLKTVALVRHPRPLVAAGVCYGRTDLVLHPEVDVAAMARGLAAGRDPVPIWSSPARRCAAVALALGAVWGHAPVFDARLLEMDFGAWEGLAWDDVPRSALDAWAVDVWGFAGHGGESGAALVARVTAAWRAMAAAGQDCLVVAHAGPLKVLQALAEGRAVDLLAPSQPVGSVVVVPCGLRQG